MQKAILLEVEGRSGIVLTPKGEFKRVPLPHKAVAIGDEITYQEHGGWRLGWVAAAAAVLLLVLSPFGYQQWALAQPMALLMIDINPSLQLTLNGRQQVMAAEGLNSDGEAVLEGLSWRRRPVDEVTRALTARAVSAGKLDPAAEGSAVVVAIAPVEGKRLSDRQAETLVESSRSAVQTEVAALAEAKGESPRTEVAVIEATVTEVKQAKEQGLTLPRLIILQEIQLEHPEVTVEQIREAPPAQVLKSLGISPSEVFNRAEERHNSRNDAVPASSKERSLPADKSPKSNPGKGDERREEKGPKNPDSENNGNGKGNEKESPGKGNENPGKGNQNPGKGNNGNPGKGNESPGKGNENPGKGNESPGQGKGSPGQGNESPGQGNESPGKGNESPGKGNGSPGQGNENPGKGNENPGKGNENPGKGNENPGKGNENPGKGNENPGKGNQNPGKGNEKPGKGTDNPGKGN